MKKKRSAQEQVEVPSEAVHHLHRTKNRLTVATNDLSKWHPINIKQQGTLHLWSGDDHKSSQATEWVQKSKNKS